MEQVEEEEAYLRLAWAEEKEDQRCREVEEETEPPRSPSPLCSAPQEPLFAKMESPTWAAPEATVAAGRRRLDHSGEQNPSLPRHARCLLFVARARAAGGGRQPVTVGSHLIQMPQPSRIASASPAADRRAPQAGFIFFPRGNQLPAREVFSRVAHLDPERSPLPARSKPLFFLFKRQ